MSASSLDHAPDTPERSVPGVVSLVLVPVILSMVVTLARLTAELSSAPPPVPTILGITWLIPVFGILFGVRLARAGAGPRRMGPAIGIALLAIVAMFGLLQVFMVVDLTSVPTPDDPGPPKGMLWLGVATYTGVVCALVAWPRLAGALLLYAIPVRLFVVFVTWLVLRAGWEGSHYDQVPPGLVVESSDELFRFAASVQAFAWVPVTVVFGTLIGVLAAAAFGRRRPAA